MPEVTTTKRSIVSAFLGRVVDELRMMEDASNPYPVDSDEVKRLTELTNGLVSIHNDGYEQPFWAYRIPTDEQVEDLFLRAVWWMELDIVLEAETGGGDDG